MTTKSYEKLAEDSVSQHENDEHEPPKKPTEDDSFLGKIKEKLNVFKADGFKIIVGGCIVFSTALTIALVVDIYTKPPPKGHGAVASDSPICSKIGTDILDDRGSAVDAAVAVAFCLAVVRFSSTGLASGGYLLSHAPNGIDELFDFQYLAPSGSSKDMFNGKKDLVQKGGLAVAVPGFVKGLEKAHSSFGYKPWKELVEKSIPLAKNGFKVDAFTAQKITLELSGFTKELKDILAPGGVPLKEGATLKLPKLADVLTKIAKDGSKGFYEGDVPAEIAKAVNSTGGIVTTNDLKNYEAVSRKPITATIGKYKMISSPGPSSGPIAFLALNILDELEFGKSGMYSLKSYQYLAEAFKFAFAQRTLLGDPKFVKSDITLDVIKKDLAKKIAKMVKVNETFSPSYYGPKFKQPNTKGTSSFVVLGTNGDMVSCISSIGNSFGSKVVTESGIILNNGMGSFSSPGFPNIFDVEPAEANYIKPGKRPISAACPILAFDSQKPCQTHYISAAADDVKAISSTVEVLWNLLNFGHEIAVSVEAPRIHHQLQPNVLRAEGSKFDKSFMSQILKDLRKIGHSVDSTVLKLGSVHLAGKKDSTIITHADSRTGGSAIKF